MINFGDADNDQILLRQNEDNTISVFIQQSDCESLEKQQAVRVLQKVIRQATQARDLLTGKQAARNCQGFEEDGEAWTINCSCGQGSTDLDACSRCGATRKTWDETIKEQA